MLFHILFIFTNSIIEPTEFEVEETSTSKDTNAYSSDGEYCLPPVEVYIDNNPTKAEKENATTAGDYNVLPVKQFLQLLKISI